LVDEPKLPPLERAWQVLFELSLRSARRERDRVEDFAVRSTQDPCAMTCRFGVPHHVISIAVTGRTHCDADTDRKKHLTAVERDGRAQVRQNTIRDDLRIGHVLQRIEENGKVVIAGAHCEIIVEGGIPDAEAPLQTSSDRREQPHVWALVDLFRTSNSSNVDQQDPKSKVLALLPSCDGVGDAI
jgi:hypothetical protein